MAQNNTVIEVKTWVKRTKTKSPNLWITKVPCSGLVHASISTLIYCFSIWYRDKPPSRIELETVENKFEAIPVKYCHVDNGRVSFLSFNEVTFPTLPWWIAVGIIRSLLMFLECWSCNCNIYRTGVWSLCPKILSQKADQLFCLCCVSNAAWYYVKTFLLWKLCWSLANGILLAH
jgi:hypothetical protein